MRTPCGRTSRKALKQDKMGGVENIEEVFHLPLAHGAVIAQQGQHRQQAVPLEAANVHVQENQA